MIPTCYGCDQPGTTTEHIPPLCLFPEKKDLPRELDFRRNLITVPSCPAHNLKKSGDDEYLMYVLTMVHRAAPAGEQHFGTKVMRAIDRRPALINGILTDNLPITLRDPGSGEAYETAAITVDAPRLESSLHQIALGLHRHHLQCNWEGPLYIHPEFLRFLREPQAAEWNATLMQMEGYADRLFQEAPFHGENREVFSYQIALPDERVPVAIRMHFYEGVRVMALFGLQPNHLQLSPD